MDYVIGILQSELNYTNYQLKSWNEEMQRVYSRAWKHLPERKEALEKAIKLLNNE